MTDGISKSINYLSHSLYRYQQLIINKNYPTISSINSNTT